MVRLMKNRRRGALRLAAITLACGVALTSTAPISQCHSVARTVEATATQDAMTSADTQRIAPMEPNVDWLKKWLRSIRGRG